MDISPEEFRRYGHQLIDWVADYLAQPERYPVLSRVQPGEIKDQLPVNPPQQAESMDAILQDFENIILPGITHWNHPGFHAYFSTSASAPAILGELLIAALNVNGMLWRTSPAATELEEVTLDWLRQMIGLSADFKGIITDTASISTMLAIAAAREALNLDIRRKGMAGMPRLRLYTSEQAHSSVEKGAMALGIGQEGVRKIPTDAAYRMDVSALKQAIEEDIAAGWLPFCVTASVGTTATTSIDPVPEIAALCQQHHLWLHIDAAYGGSAAIVPEMRHIMNGCEYADSLVTNPHKWLFTPMDLSAFYVRDPHILQRAFSLIPEYLKTSETNVTNYMDWGVQLGRRFRALKLWMVIRTFGQEGLAQLLRSHIQMAQTLAAQIDAHPDFERLAPTPFSTLCFRYHPQGIQDESTLEKLNAHIVEQVNASGEAFIAPTKLRDQFTIRLAIGNIRTTEAHIQHLWERIQTIAKETH